MVYALLETTLVWRHPAECACLSVCLSEVEAVSYTLTLYNRVVVKCARTDDGLPVSAEYTVNKIANVGDCGRGKLR